MDRGLGFIPNEVDERDDTHRFELLGLTAAAPIRAMEMDVHYRVQDQGITNSCTGTAARQATNIWQRANLGELAIDSSALGNYRGGRVFHAGLKDVDVGSYIRSTFRGMNAYGMVANDAWPFDPMKVLQQPPPQALLRAYKTRKCRYRRIFSTGDALVDACRSSVASLRPFVFGIPVHDSFMGAGPSRIVAPRPGDKERGWHAIECHGYERTDSGIWFRIGNSWGDWRDEGCAWLHADYIKNHATDVTAIEMVRETA